MSNILKIENLTKNFGSGENIITAVDNISFTMEAGEFLAILGPSGSGKTTLLSMIGGIIQPTSGKIFIEGINLSELGEKERSRVRREKIGFVFQYHNLVPHLSAMQNLLLAAEINGENNKLAKERAEKLLKELDLGSRSNNIPSQLSGGQRQRVAIGRAFMNDPALILVDEPTASLDTERGEQVVKSIASQIKNSGKIGIMVTHDLRMCKYVDRVINMVDGKVQSNELILDYQNSNEQIEFAK